MRGRKTPSSEDLVESGLSDEASRMSEALPILVQLASAAGWSDLATIPYIFWSK